MTQALGQAQSNALEQLRTEERLTPAMIADEQDVTRQRAHSILSSLVDRGDAHKVAQGLYAPTEK